MDAATRKLAMREIREIKGYAEEDEQESKD